MGFGCGVGFVDAAQPAYFSGSPLQTRYFDAHSLMLELLASRERAAAVSGVSAPGLEAELQEVLRRTEECRAALQLIQDSLSWRMTAPLRAAKSRTRGPQPAKTTVSEAGAAPEAETPEARLAAAREDLQRHLEAVAAAQRSLSWRVTAPLRQIKSAAPRSETAREDG